MRRIASVISAPTDDFLRIWHDTFDKQLKGDLPNDQATIQHICQALNVPVEDEQIKTAARIKFDIAKREITTLRGDAEEVLLYLKSKGYKIGLISNCSYETPIIWKEVPLASLVDVAVFSCLVGVVKPDPRIYQIATEQLDVQPQRCLYVADGMGQELVSASNLGMHAVQIFVPGEDEYEPYREEWNGPVISSLREVLTLVR